MAEFDPDDEGTTITCVVFGDHEVRCNGTVYTSQSRFEPGETWFWVCLGVYIILVLLAGVFSGLTLGLLSLDTTTLQVLIRAGTPSEQKNAKRILPLVKRHHLLLVTLLLANAAAVESMPLFMNKISNEYIAIIVSVTAVLFFGEVFPQALCSRYGLAIGAALVPFVYLLFGVFFIIAWPISKLLDCLLGQEHATFFRRAEIKAIVDLHGEAAHLGGEDPLTYDEVLIIKGALDMRTKVGCDAMLPLPSAFMLDIESRLDAATMKQISDQTYSRIPIYEGHRHNVVAILLVKTLISLDPEDAVPLRELIKERQYCRRVLHKPANTPLYDLLNEFQKGKSHMCLLTREKPVVPGYAESPPSVTSAVSNMLGQNNRKDELIGLITLEDVIEELLGEEIIDETDVYEDVHRRLHVARARTPNSSRSAFGSKMISRQDSSISTVVHSTSDDERASLLPFKL